MNFAEIGTANTLASSGFIRALHECISMLDAVATIGFPGGIAGAAVAFLITIAQKQIPWRRPIHIKLGARIIDFPTPAAL